MKNYSKNRHILLDKANALSNFFFVSKGEIFEI